MIMILNEDNTLLLIIDIQEKLLNAVFNKDKLEKNAVILAKTASMLKIPTIVTEQYPKGLGPTVNDLKTVLDEKVAYFEKCSFNALDEEPILERLKEHGKKQIILCGIETHICVHQTAKALIDSGFNVILVKNACGSRNIEEHTSAIEYMKDYGVNIKTTEMILFEILKSSKHPNFKDIQNFIK